MSGPIGENVWAGDPTLCTGQKDPGEPVKIEIPREVKVAIQAGIDAYMACVDRGIPAETAVSFAGVAFNAVITIEENQRDRDFNLEKQGIYLKKVG